MRLIDLPTVLHWRRLPMLILKYFATVGAVLTAAILALSTYLEPSNPDEPVRVLHSATTDSLLIVTPKPQARGVIDPDRSQPKAAPALATQPTRHGDRAR